MGCASSTPETVSENKKMDTVNNNTEIIAKIEEIKAKYPDNCCA